MSQAPFPSLTQTWHTQTYPAIDPTLPQLSQKGKVVVITGSGSGIGSAIAKAFAQAGATKIALIGRTQSTLEHTKQSILAAVAPSPVDVLLIPADISERSSIKAAFDTIGQTFGKIDIFVSNAAFLNTPANVAVVDPEDWWTAFKTNALGALHSIQAFLPHAASNAFLLNVSTAVAHFPPIPGHSGYAASKLAGTKLLDYVAVENKWLRVVHPHPGVVETTINHKSGSPSFDHVDLPAWFSVWLASPEARFLNRRFVYANWDVDELKKDAELLRSRPSELTLGLYGLPAADMSPFGG